jgi:hypothetical protein
MTSEEHDLMINTPSRCPGVAAAVVAFNTKADRRALPGEESPYSVRAGLRQAPLRVSSLRCGPLRGSHAKIPPF